MNQNYSRSISFIRTLIIALALTAVVIGVASLPGHAAPPAAPTPVAAPDSVGVGTYFPIQATSAITADTNSAWRDISKFQTVDIEYVIDQTDVNTVTLNVQYSIDGSTATAGVALVSANAADAGALVARVPAFGRYLRVEQDVSTSDLVTITITAVGR